MIPDHVCGICYHQKDVCSHCDAKALATLAAAAKTVLRGFDEGVFVRNTAHDQDPGWAIRLMPFIAALAIVKRAVDP